MAVWFDNLVNIITLILKLVNFNIIIDGLKVNVWWVNLTIFLGATSKYLFRFPNLQKNKHSVKLIKNTDANVEPSFKILRNIDPNVIGKSNAYQPRDIYFG